MPVFLGLDLGEKRIGVALSDELGKIAVPFDTWEFKGREALEKKIRAVMAEYPVSAVIVGFPMTLKGDAGIAAQKVMKQVEWLKSRIETQWVLWDERMTTAEVEKLLISADVSRAKRKDVRDRLGAQRILQSYLDRQQVLGN